MYCATREQQHVFVVHEIVPVRSFVKRPRIAKCWYGKSPGVQLGLETYKVDINMTQGSCPCMLTVSVEHCWPSRVECCMDTRAYPSQFDEDDEDRHLCYDYIRGRVNGTQGCCSSCSNMIIICVDRKRDCDIPFSNGKRSTEYARAVSIKDIAFPENSPEVLFS